MGNHPENTFDSALRSWEASGKLPIYIRFAFCSVAVESPRDSALLARGYAEVWQPYFETHWTRLAPKVSQSKAAFVRDGHFSAIWGTCTRATGVTASDRATLIILAGHLAARVLRQHGVHADAVSAYHLEIDLDPNGMWEVHDRLLLRPDIPCDDVAAGRGGCHRTLTSTHQ